MREVKKHIWLIEETEFGDGVEYLPGWYFSDETSGIHGPFGTIEECERNLKSYCELL